MTTIFRHRMDWLHRWGGLVLGSLLVLIVFMGTLSVYDHEIDSWMMPATRLTLPAKPLPLDTIRQRVAGLIDPTQNWFVILPDERRPFIELVGTKNGGPVERQLDTATGAVLPEAQTLGATGFFFPLHYSLMIKFKMIGIWIVAFASMAMLALLVSGVVIHRGLFKKFFTLRIGPPLRRFSLDLHAVTGVVVLPFHVGIVVTGLIMYATTTMPAAVAVLYDTPKQFSDEAYDRAVRPPAGRLSASKPASLDAMVEKARGVWGHGEPFFLQAINPADEKAVVRIRRNPTDHIGDDGETIFFDGVTGDILDRATPTHVVHVATVLGGMHLLQFKQNTLRFLYFLAGLAGCVMIGTGFVIFAEKRRDADRHPILVDALALSSTLGMMVATAAYLVAHQMLPPTSSRPTLEVTIFFAVWTLSFLAPLLTHVRGIRWSWQVQSYALSILCLAAVLMNWIATGLPSLAEGRRAAGGVDLALIVTGAGALGFATVLRRSAKPMPVPDRDGRAR